jgi:hypothetical protein
MDLGAAIVSALPELRRQAVSRMLDTCTIRRVTGDAVDADGNVTPTYSAPLYAGLCRVQTNEPQERTPDTGDVGTVTTQRYSVHVPVGAYAPQVGDVVTIDYAHLDPYLAGRIYRVVGLLHKSQATAYRLSVEEVVR